MDSSKIVAVITGVISLVLGLVYLLVVQILDFRGEMVPAPTGQLPLQVNLLERVNRLEPSGLGNRIVGSPSPRLNSTH